MDKKFHLVGGGSADGPGPDTGYETFAEMREAAEEVMAESAEIRRECALNPGPIYERFNAARKKTEAAETEAEGATKQAPKSFAEIDVDTIYARLNAPRAHSGPSETLDETV